MDTLTKTEQALARIFALCDAVAFGEKPTPSVEDGRKMAAAFLGGPNAEVCRPALQETQPQVGTTDLLAELEGLCVSLDDDLTISRCCVDATKSGDISPSIALLHAQSRLLKLCEMLGHKTLRKLTGLSANAQAQATPTQPAANTQNHE